MKIKPFFPVFLVLVGVVIYAYYAPQKKPERASTLTPKQYIELVEKNRSQRSAGLPDTDTPQKSEPEPAERPGKPDASDQH